MKTLKICFVLASIFALMPGLVTAQIVNPEQDTIIWKSASLLDKNTSQTVSVSTEFMTYGTSVIDWVQKVNSIEKKYSFPVTSSLGLWQDVETDGAKVYEVSFNDRSGRITIQRQGSTTRISLEFLDNGVNKMPFEFTVYEIQKQN